MLNHWEEKKKSHSITLWRWTLGDKQLGAGEIFKGFPAHFDFLSSHSCPPASPSTAASAMLDGRPHRTALPAHRTEMSATSSLRLVQRLWSVSTLQALSIVGPVPQVCGRVYASQRHCAGFCLPARHGTQTSFLLLPKDKKPVLRRRSNPASCPISLTPTLDHLPAVTVKQQKWEVCLKLCSSQTLGAGLAIVCEVNVLCCPQFTRLETKGHGL